MGILQTLGQGQGHLRAGFQGFQASGKTWTAVLLALGVKKFFNLDGPIVMFDTEGGSEYIAPMVKRETGADLVGVRSRSLDDLLESVYEAKDLKASVMITDSMTHIWRDVCDAYLKQINALLVSRNKSPRTKIQFEDWNPIKAKFGRWTDAYLNMPIHMIICGRAGFEYGYETDEDGKRELLKTGIKMKTEGEFGFEPSLLVQMDRIQNLDGDGKPVGGWSHHAEVIKDRFGLIDGSECDDPTFDFFLPHIQALTPGAFAPIDTEVKTDVGVRDDGDGEWQTERRQRVILCEEIQGELTTAYPGQTKEEKQSKLALIHEAFGTKSWTKVETMKSEALRVGLQQIREKVGALPPAAAPETGEEVA